MLDVQSPETAGEERAVGQVPVSAGTTGAKKPVLIVLHQENSNPGHVGQWFVRNGHHLDIRKPRFGEPLPATLADHCGAVIFGGPMSANDKDDFIREEIDWIGVALKEKAPFLGICLGAQMLALHLGAKVGFDPEDRAEIGYYPLRHDSRGQPARPVPRSRLSVAPRGLRAAPRCAATCHLRRRLPQPGLRLRPGGVRRAVPPRDHVRPGAPLDRPQQHAPADEGRSRPRASTSTATSRTGPRCSAWLGGFLDRWARAELSRWAETPRS